MNRLTRVSLPFIVFVFTLSLSTIGQETTASIRVRGTNILQLAQGDKNIHDVRLRMPWNYATDYLDFHLGIQQFFVTARFQADQSSLGLNPISSVFREFVSRRTFGFVTEHITLSGGHCKTIFGKGLSLNLQEDVTIEKANILDGVFFKASLPAVSVQAIAGRPVGKSGSATETDPNYRDNIIGVYAETYPFASLPKPAFITSASSGAGLVYFGKNVSRPAIITVIDSSQGKKDTISIGYQKKNDIFVPSLDIAASMNNLDAAIEAAWLLYRDHDTANLKAATVDRANSSSIYATLSTQLGSLSLVGEYKNYFFAQPYTPQKANLPKRMNNPGFDRVSQFIEPPLVRYKHSWFLLTKQIKSATTDDVLGYAATVVWPLKTPTTLVLHGAAGGAHRLTSAPDGYSWLFFSRKKRYWETYGEIEHEVSPVISGKIGVDAGHINPA
ncbi:MAG: hypothetical protein JW795_15365, partial [Chitinivibrionales bacterium]|nr:hypothetical protein [Chitinivibrionales bacterium]